MQFHEFQAKRKVASFGFDWNFDTQSLTKGKEIPVLFNPLIEKLATRLSIKSTDFGEILITEYPVGSVINWHRDAPPFDTIVGISLLADCIFKLRPHDKAKQGRHSVITFPLKRRSMYIMKSEARTAWQHSIAPVKAIRYSITFRTLKEKNQ